MPTSNEGRRCQYCVRQVYDFDSMPPERIREILSAEKHVCARVSLQSLRRQPSYQRASAFILSTAMLVAPGIAATQNSAGGHSPANSEAQEPQTARAKQDKATGVHGTITLGGRRAPGIKVTAKHSLDSKTAGTTSDADGNYSFDDLLPGTYSVEFDFGILGEAEEKAVVVCPGIMLTRDSHGPHRFVGIAGLSHRNGDQVASPRSGIFGYVRGPDRTARSDVTITATASSGAVASSSKSSSIGEFDLAGLSPGIYSLRFSAPGLTSETLSGVEVQEGYQSYHEVYLCPAR